eukprot:m.266087 g.266087  ORF g.266087 m.266087 type:complete len:506 (-) comp19270_c0_seq11:605-2122(-)
MDFPSRFALIQEPRPPVVDTNYVVLHPMELGTPVKRVAAAPLTCSYCGAVASTYSEIAKAGWQCEFCGTLMAGSKVSKKLRPALESATVDYVLEGASKKKSTFNVIFCIDTSGSMCVTSPVTGPEGGEPHYVSRMAQLKRAVHAQIDSLARDHPKCRVGLVAFDSNVRVLGDGSGNEELLAEDALLDYDALAAFGATKPDCLKKTVKEAKATLQEKLEQLTEGGQTALGPSLLVAVSLAASHSGSQVIVCTDGLSNIGLGALHTSATEIERSYSQAFFHKVGVHAVEAGVRVSVISLAGEECNLQQIGSLADFTGGTVTRVRPEELATSVSAVAQRPVVATRAKARLFLHCRLMAYQAGRPIAEPTGLNGELRVLGSVSDGCGDEAFHFGSTPSEVLTTLPHPPPEIPLRPCFQIQMDYWAQDGTHCLRVITRDLPVTDSTQQVRAERTGQRRDTRSIALALGSVPICGGFSSTGIARARRCNVFGLRLSNNSLLCIASERARGT